MCGNLISLRRTVFQDWRLVKKSSSIDPETPERAIISVFKSYLVHLGSFKRHILYFCASIVDKIRSHWGEPYEAKFVVVFLQTDQVYGVFSFVPLNKWMNEQKRTIQRKNEKMRCNENMKACEQRRSVEVCTHPSNPTIHPYPSLNYFTACSTFINQSSSEFLLKFKGKINITMEKCCLIAPCYLCRRLRTVSFFS